MKRIRCIIVLVLGLLICVSVDAQRQRSTAGNNNSQQTSSRASASGENKASQRNRVQYIKNSMKQVGDSLVVDMDIDMTKINLQTNHAQILTPVIGSESEEIELPKVMIQGTARNKAFVRELELNDRAYEEFENNLPYAIVKPNGKLNYRMAVPYEPWMSNAYLDVEED